MYLCMYGCMYVCACVCVCDLSVCMCVCIYVPLWVCMRWNLWARLAPALAVQTQPECHTAGKLWWLQSLVGVDDVCAVEVSLQGCSQPMPSDLATWLCIAGMWKTWTTSSLGSCMGVPGFLSVRWCANFGAAACCSSFSNRLADVPQPKVSAWTRAMHSRLAHAMAWASKKHGCKIIEEGSAS